MSHFKINIVVFDFLALRFHVEFQTYSSSMDPYFFKWVLVFFALMHKDALRTHIPTLV